MTKIRAREISARVAVAGGVERLRVQLEPARLGIHLPLPFYPDRSIPAVPGGRDAIEHVYAPRDRLDQVIRIAHAHHVARQPGRQLGLQGLEHRIHFGLWLAHRETPDGDAVPIPDLERP